MNKLLNPLGLIVTALVLLLLSSMAFTVGEREKAIKLRLGKIAESEFDPGLHWKIPLIDTVHKFDKRILTLDVNPQLVLTREKKNVIVDFFVKWRVADPRTYYTRFSGIKTRADSSLTQIGNKEVRNAFKQRTIRQVVSSARSTLMDEIRDSLGEQARTLGIEVIDVRVKKVELPEDVRESVYRRMEKDRAKIASEIRSTGDESAKKIRATADRIREQTLATAYSQAEITRGTGDAESARVYAEAYSQNPKFYSLYRSLSAYRRAFSGNNDVLLLNPNSEFFRYFNGSQGTTADSAQQ